MSAEKDRHERAMETAETSAQVDALVRRDRWQCESCGKDLPEDYEPHYCCNGMDCGCRGMPTNPPICDFCWHTGMPYYDLKNCKKLTIRVNQRDIDNAEKHLQAGLGYAKNPFRFAIERLGLRVEFQAGWIYFYKGEECLGGYWNETITRRIRKYWPNDREKLKPKTLIFKDPYTPPST